MGGMGMGHGHGRHGRDGWHDVICSFRCACSAVRRALAVTRIGCWQGTPRCRDRCTPIQAHGKTTDRWALSNGLGRSAYSESLKASDFAAIDMTARLLGMVAVSVPRPAAARSGGRHRRNPDGGFFGWHMSAPSTRPRSRRSPSSSSRIRSAATSRSNSPTGRSQGDQPAHALPGRRRP